MDYDTLKDQWSEVEDRDGIRLSWNCIPSTRMACTTLWYFGDRFAYCYSGSLKARRTHRCPLYTFEGEA